MNLPVEIVLPDRLQGLVKHCETFCAAECCGIDAFDFSPLNVASFLAAFRGDISESDIREWESQIQQAEKLTVDLQPDKDGYLCSISGMNQNFRKSDFDAFLAELLHSVRVSPQVLEFSNRLRKSEVG